MPKIEVSEVIERPVEEVWTYLTDPDAMPEWVASTRSVEFLTEGGMRKGARIREVSRFLGRSIESVNEVVEHEPPNCYRLQGLEGPFESSVEFDLQPAGDSTRVTVKVEAEQGLGGVFGKLLDPVVTAAFRRESQSDLARLKDILEAQAAEEAS